MMMMMMVMTMMMVIMMMTAHSDRDNDYHDGWRGEGECPRTVKLRRIVVREVASSILQPKLKESKQLVIVMAIVMAMMVIVTIFTDTYLVSSSNRPSMLQPQSVQKLTGAA